MSTVDYESDKIKGMEGITVTPLKSKGFIWTDEKSELLLKVVHEYKIRKSLHALTGKLSEQSAAA